MRLLLICASLAMAWPAFATDLPPKNKIDYPDVGEMSDEEYQREVIEPMFQKAYAERERLGRLCLGSKYETEGGDFYALLPKTKVCRDYWKAFDHLLDLNYPPDLAN